MNLIHCANDCIYQQDGYCTLDQPSKITGQAVDGCCHYQPRLNISQRKKKE